MASRRPRRLKFLEKIKSVVILRISVVRCVVSQATKIVANIKSVIILRLLIQKIKFNELLFETRWLFVAKTIILLTRKLELPDRINNWLYLVQLLPALLAGDQIRIIAEKYNMNIPEYIKEYLVYAIALIIVGLPPF